MMTRPRLTISNKALVCQDNDLRGNITVGAGKVYWISGWGDDTWRTVLHPQCKVWATGGSIIFGSGNIVEENAIIINRGPDALIIGNNNVFEVGSTMEGAKMGDRNTLEVRSHVKAGTWVGDDCVIGAVCTTNEGEMLEDKTVVFGSNNERRTHTGSRASQNIIHGRHLDYLMQTLPKFNHARSST